MALRLYLIGLISTLLLSSFLWLLLIFSINPFQAPLWIIILFYIAFFVAWTSVFALINFYLKVHLGNHEVIFSHIKPSLRQAALLSIILTAIVFFEQIKVLNWWVFGMFVVSIGLIELFYRSKK